MHFKNTRGQQKSAHSLCKSPKGPCEPIKRALRDLLTDLVFTHFEVSHLCKVTGECMWTNIKAYLIVTMCSHLVFKKDIRVDKIEICKTNKKTQSNK